MLKFTKYKVETVLLDTLYDRVHKHRKYGFHHGPIQKLLGFVFVTNYMLNKQEVI